MTLTLNGKEQDTGPAEDFATDREPLMDSPIDPPEQLPLELKPKTQGDFTKKAGKLIERSGPKIRGGGT